VDTGGWPLTGCTVTSSSGQSQNCTAGSGTATFTEANYGATYTYTVTATSELGTGQDSASAAAAGKPLVVDGGTRWDGACTWDESIGGRPWYRPYYTNPAHACPNDPGRQAGWVAHDTTVLGLCVTTGGEIRDDELHYSNQWISIQGYGWMSPLYFVTWQTAADNLPRC
jgi:hypothetical protein